MAFCASCGSEVAAGVTACTNCGAPVAAAAPPPPPSEPETSTKYPWASTVQPAGSTRRGGIGGWIAAAGGLLVLLSVWLPWLTADGESYSGWDGLTDCLDYECPVSELFVVTDPFLLVTLIPMIIGGLLVLFGIVAAVAPGSARMAAVGLVILLGLAAVATALIDLVQILTGDAYEGVSAGFGIWLWLLAGIGALAGGLTARR